MEWYRMSGGGTDTSDANAVASNILSGKTAYVNDEKIIGTMEDNSGITKDASSVSQDSDYVNLNVPSNGYYSTSSKIRTLLSNIDSSFTFTKLSLTNSSSTSGSYKIRTYTGKIPANTKGYLIILCTLDPMSNTGTRNDGTVSVNIPSGIIKKATITSNDYKTICNIYEVSSASNERTVELIFKGGLSYSSGSPEYGMVLMSY